MLPGDAGVGGVLEKEFLLVGPGSLLQGAVHAEMELNGCGTDQVEVLSLQAPCASLSD